MQAVFKIVYMNVSKYSVITEYQPAPVALNKQFILSADVFFGAFGVVRIGNF